MNTRSFLSTLSLFGILFLFHPQIKAQTNTFPSTGFVGIGTTTPAFALTAIGTEWNSSQISLTTYAGNPAPGGTDNYTPQFRFEKARGSVISGQKVEDGDRIGAFLAAGFDGSKMQRSAVFGFRVDAPTSAGNVPIGFFVQTGDASANKPERLLVKSDGGIVLKDLSGAGTRMVVANDTGLLSTADITDGDWTVSGSDMYSALSGFVGIGIPTPAYKLDIRGDNTDDGGLLQIANSDQSHRMLFFSGREFDPGPFIMVADGDPIRFATDAGGYNEYVRIQNGNVGIGNTAPAFPIDIKQNANVGAAFIRVSGGPTNGFAGVIIDRATSSDRGYVIMRENGGDRWFAGMFDGNDDYRISSTGSTTPFVIDRTTGNVGIGTTTPGYPLDILKTSTNNAAFIRVKGGPGNGWAGLILDKVGVGDASYIIYQQNGVDQWLAGQYAGEDFRISRANANEFVIDKTTGYVGINASTPTTQLHVIGEATITGTAFIASANISNGDFVAAAGNGVINCGGSLNSLANVIGDATSPTQTFATGDEDLWIEDDLEVLGQGYKPGGGSWATVSDKRLKKNVEPFTDGLAQLMQVKPVTYQYNEKALVYDHDSRYVGVLAQEMLEIAPYMVEERAMGMKVQERADGSVEIMDPGEMIYTVDPSAFDYMLINSVQEQQAIIENQNDRITELESELAAIKQILGLNEGARTSSGNASELPVDPNGNQLFQNRPNPFDNSTEIPYFLSESAKNGEIIITSSATGAVVKTFGISGAGNGSVKLQSDVLASGVYTSTLIVDGKVVDSKKMVISR